jgi:hypothetical protein
MHKSATKCNETIGKWCKNKQGASKISFPSVRNQGMSNPGKSQTPEGDAD